MADETETQSEETEPTYAELKEAYDALDDNALWTHAKIVESIRNERLNNTLTPVINEALQVVAAATAAAAGGASSEFQEAPTADEVSKQSKLVEEQGTTEGQESNAMFKSLATDIKTLQQSNLEVELLDLANLFQSHFKVLEDKIAELTAKLNGQVQRTSMVYGMYLARLQKSLDNRRRKDLEAQAKAAEALKDSQA